MGCVETGSFLVNGNVAAVGTFTFTRADNATPIEAEPDEVPGTHVLSAAYPNPFNPQTTFTLTARQAQHIRVDVFDLRGRQVALLFDGFLEADTPRRFTLQGNDLPSGVYIYRAVGEVFRDSRAALLVK